MSKFYGFPYMGSKNKLAKRIVSILPKREHLYDLFCGGCAITHRAMEINKYNHIHINDINPLCTQLFHDALNGKYENEDRWISRDDFHRLKNTDPYVACCFSFGNNFRTYAYSPEIEPKKKALHYAIFFGDYTLAKKELGVDLSPLEKCPTHEKKYLLAKRIIKERFDLQSAESLSRFAPPNTARNGDLEATIGRASNESQQYQDVTLELYEAFNRLQRILQITPPNIKKKLQYKHTLTMSALDYQDVEILPNSCIICDIPYIDTAKYTGKGESFDHERFYTWAERQTEPLFICSYWMPEDRFDIVAEFSRTDTFKSNNKKVIERLFVPKGQDIRGNIELKLF